MCDSRGGQVQGIQSIGYSDRCSETHGEWFSLHLRAVFRKNGQLGPAADGHPGSDQEPVMPGPLQPNLHDVLQMQQPAAGTIWYTCTENWL